MLKTLTIPTNLDLKETLIYTIIAANAEDGVALITRDEIADIAMIKKLDTVSGSLKSLKEKGLFTSKPVYTHKIRTNAYTLAETDGVKILDRVLNLNPKIVAFIIKLAALADPETGLIQYYDTELAEQLGVSRHTFSARRDLALESKALKTSELGYYIDPYYLPEQD